MAGAKRADAYSFLMAAPPIITENGALFLAQQATRKRSLLVDSKRGWVFRSARSAFKAAMSAAGSWREGLGSKAGGPDDQKETQGGAKIVTVVRTIRRATR